MERRVSPWIEVAPALLISPRKPSTSSSSSKLETIFEEEGSIKGGNYEQQQQQKRKLLFYLFLSSLYLFMEMWFHGMISMMKKNHQILSWVQRLNKFNYYSKSSNNSSSLDKTTLVQDGTKLM